MGLLVGLHLDRIPARRKGGYHRARRVHAYHRQVSGQHEIDEESTTSMSMYRQPACMFVLVPGTMQYQYINGIINSVLYCCS